MTWGLNLFKKCWILRQCTPFHFMKTGTVVNSVNSADKQTHKQTALKTLPHWWR